MHEGFGGKSQFSHNDFFLTTLAPQTHMHTHRQTHTPEDYRNSNIYIYFTSENEFGKK